MDKVRLGKSELLVSKTAMGCLPIQRISEEEAISIVRKAYENGINYFDTANAYTDSEMKLGKAFKGIRENVIISTKSAATDYDGVMNHILNSLKMLDTDYIDLFQFHNPAVLPDRNDPHGSYAAALKAKELGYIKHIGITNHRLHIAHEAIESGDFETLQFPFCYLTTDKELELVKKCKEKDIGFIAMKGLSGGLLNNARACYAFMNEYDNVVPIWGIQKMSELDEWLALSKENPKMDEDIKKVIEKDRKELLGNFCRSCGYCLPCSAGIDIPQAARMSQLLRRSPYKQYLTDEWYKKMLKINDCIHCDSCKSKCPYNLDTPELLKLNQLDYLVFYAEHVNEDLK